MTDLPAAVSAATDNFRIGQSFGRSFAILGRNAAVFVPLGALAALPDLLQHLQQLRHAFEAIVAVVTYHDLRVAKEGVDIDRIAAVFD